MYHALVGHRGIIQIYLYNTSMGGHTMLTAELSRKSLMPRVMLYSRQGSKVRRGVELKIQYISLLVWQKYKVCE